MAGTHDATFYVQITADFGRTWQNGEYVQSVSAAKAVIVVPEDMVVTAPLEVEAEDPTGGDE